MFTQKESPTGFYVAYSEVSVHRIAAEQAETVKVRKATETPNHGFYTFLITFLAVQMFLTF